MPGRARGPAATRNVCAVLASVSLAAGLIHVAVIPEHLEEYMPFGAFFVVVTVFQLVWAVAIVVRPSAFVLASGALASGAMIAIWAMARTTGLPIGPEPWTAEPVAALDLMANVLALLILIGSWRLLSAGAPLKILRRPGTSASPGP